MNNELTNPEPSNAPGQVPAELPPRPMRRSMPPVTAGATASGGLTPAFVWQVFCKWWKWLVPAGLLFSVIAGVVVWYLHVPRFEAKALVKIEAEMPFIAFEDGRGGNDSDRYVQTQIEMLRGPVVLNRLLSRPEIIATDEIRSQFDPLKQLQENLSVRQVGKSELYEVTYTSSSADDAATVANSVVLDYLTVQTNEEQQRTGIVIEMLEKERLDRAQKVEQLRRRVVDLAKDLTGRDPFGQGVVTDVSAFSPTAALYQELTEVDVSLEVVKAELQALHNAPIISADRAAATGLLELEISNRLDVRQLESRVAEIEDEMARVKSRPRTKIGDSWETDPTYVRLIDLLHTTRETLQARKETARQQLIAMRQEQQEVEQQSLISIKEQELATLNKKRELLSAKLKEHLNELKAGGAQSAELEFAKSELEREQKVFELIAARKLALQTEMRAPARVSLMDKARVPSVAIEPIPYKLLFIACLVALVAPLGLVVGREAVVRRVRDGEQLTQEAELPLLGEVSRLPTRKVDTRRQLLAPQQRDLLVYTESIDSLRVTLALTEQVGVPGQNKIVALCSAVSGEGKTTVAASLAVSIAEASKRPVLIIDADLRDPDVANYLAVPAEPGLAEVLAGDASFSDAIHRVADTRAYVLPAGGRRLNPHQIVDGTKIHDLFDKLREKFATIILDTPPVLAASESLVYAKACDLVVFCSLAEVSRSKQVRVATNRLESTGAHIAGAVLSGVPIRQYVYSYGNYAAVSKDT